MSAKTLAFLQGINDEVNVIPYEALATTPEEYDWWCDAPEARHTWECRDYTVAKAKLMRERGWSPEDMGVVLCDTEGGEYHAVQFAKTDGAIYILDNRAPEIYRWDDPPYQYKWLWQQVPGTLDFRDASAGLV